MLPFGIQRKPEAGRRSWAWCTYSSIVSICSVRLQPVRRRETLGRSPMDSLARASRDANVDAPRRYLGVFLLAHEVELGRPDIGVPGELAHLVHGRPVPDGVVDRRLAQRVDADTTGSQPRGIDAGGLAVFLDQPPWGFAV